MIETPLLIYIHLKYKCYFQVIYFCALLCLKTNFDLFVFARDNKFTFIVKDSISNVGTPTSLCAYVSDTT